MNWKQKIFELIDEKKIFTNLEEYVDLVLKHNQFVNLTGFNEEKIWQEGIYQSIFLLDFFLNDKNDFELLDIGAGAGFPSIPYLLFRKNDFNLTIIESNIKRINFLKIVKEKFKLNLTLINKRVEETDSYEIFDFITARAVTSFKNLVEISAKLGKINSHYFFLKSKKYSIELEESKKILNILGIKNVKINFVNLDDEKEHIVLSYYKTKQTPKGYPRKWTIINKENQLK